jgi:hypothetical protein
MKRDNKRKAVIIVIATLIVICGLLALIGYSSGINGESSNNKNIKTYDSSSIDKAVSSFSFKIDIPDIVRQEQDLEIRNIMGQIIEIGDENLVFKAASFVDNNADPLGLYDEAEIQNEYNVVSDNTDITFFKFRLNYEDYENCTLINWCTNETAYGLMLGYVITEDEALNILGIDREWLTDISIEEVEEEVTTENTDEYNLNNKLSIQLPEFSSEIQQIDMDGYTIFYMDKTMVFVVIYNDYDIDNDAFSGQSEYVVDNKTVIKYLSENPFDQGTNAYNDYDLFIGTIDNIAQTIIYH